MTLKIIVQKKNVKEGWEFKVTIEEKGNQTTHQVHMSEDFYESLNTKVEPEEVVEESFRFLLEREPKESILSQFDITVISKYFPDYKKVIKKRL